MSVTLTVVQIIRIFIRYYRAPLDAELTYYFEQNIFIFDKFQYYKMFKLSEKLRDFD